MSLRQHTRPSALQTKRFAVWLCEQFLDSIAENLPWFASGTQLVCGYDVSVEAQESMSMRVPEHVGGWRLLKLIDAEANNDNPGPRSRRTKKTANPRVIADTACSQPIHIPVTRFAAPVRSLPRDPQTAAEVAAYLVSQTSHENSPESLNALHLAMLMRLAQLAQKYEHWEPDLDGLRNDSLSTPERSILRCPNVPESQVAFNKCSPHRLATSKHDSLAVLQANWYRLATAEQARQRKRIELQLLGR